MEIMPFIEILNNQNLAKAKMVLNDRIWLKPIMGG